MMDAIDYLTNLFYAWGSSPFFIPFMGFSAICGIYKLSIFLLMGGKK